MLKIRLKRIGRKHDPSFRVVVTEVTAPPKGKYKEAVGFYNSALKQLKLNTERIKYWLSVGAQPTVSVHNILVKEGVISAQKQRAHSTRIRKKAATEEKKKEESIAKIEVDKTDNEEHPDIIEENVDEKPNGEVVEVENKKDVKQSEEEIKQEEEKVDLKSSEAEKNKKDEFVERPKDEMEPETRAEEAKTEGFAEEKIKQEVEEPKSKETA